MEIKDKMNSEISKLKAQSLAGSLTSNGSAINTEAGRDAVVRIADVGPSTPTYSLVVTSNIKLKCVNDCNVSCSSTTYLFKVNNAQVHNNMSVTLLLG